MQKILDKLKSILKKTFPKAKIPKKTKLKIGDFPEWDSLGHLNFLLSVEKSFKIKFTMEEMMAIKDLDEIIKSINKRK